MTTNQPNDGWRLYKRNFDMPKTEAVCSHGVGHHKGVHGCDGCCPAPDELWDKVTDDARDKKLKKAAKKFDEDFTDVMKELAEEEEDTLGKIVRDATSVTRNPMPKSELRRRITNLLAAERAALREKIQKMIADEIAAKPADELEKTAEWYKVSALKDVLTLLDN